MKIFIIFFSFFTVSFATMAQEKKLTWDYPVKPDTEEWKEMPYNEKIKKSQPSIELLKNWTTETLFQYCIDYPFNKVILLFNNPNDGFKRVYEQSFVWQEFIQRKDAFEILSKYLESRPYKRLLKMNNIEVRNNELFVLFFLDKIVSETNFAVNLDAENKRKLANIILQSHQSKKNYPEEFIGFHYNSSLSALLKIVESDGVLSEDKISTTDFRKITDNECFVDDSMDYAIITKTMKYIAQ
jgi:hypothetical protein